MHMHALMRRSAFGARLLRAVVPVPAFPSGDVAAQFDDLVLVVGAPVFRYHRYERGRHLPEGARLLQLTEDPAEATRAPVGESVVTRPRAAHRPA